MTSTATFDVSVFMGQDEGQHFDRKSLYQGEPGKKRARDRREVREQIAEYVAAFANSEGGVLVLGVDDPSGPPSSSRTPAQILLVPLAGTTSRVRYRVESADIEGSSVTIEGSSVPYRGELGRYRPGFGIGSTGVRHPINRGSGHIDRSTPPDRPELDGYRPEFSRGYLRH